MNTVLLCLCLSFGSGDGGLKLRQPEVPDRFFGEDKFQHFFVSFLVTSLSASGARLAGLDENTSLWVGAATGTAVGVAKELRDTRTEGETGSFLDFVWDMGGVGAATVVVAQGR
jgi:uncharacterized protein YfiM (DUF2279 family)